MVKDPEPRKIPLIFYRTLQGSEACSGVAEGPAGIRATSDRERPIASAMAVAGGNAAVQAIGKRFVGSPDGPSDETDGARAALPLP